MLCITMEAEPTIVKQYKCHYCCVCKNYRGKVMKDEKKKCLCIIFQLTRRSPVHGKKMHFWASHSTHKFLFVTRHTLDYGPSKMPLKLAL